jgi:hypothetical protein
MYAPSYVNIQTQIPILKGSVTMKKFLALVIAAIMLLLCGCGPNENEYVAHYFGGLGYDEDASYPIIAVLHNTEERDACAAEANHEKVTEALSAYDEEFFSSKVLFVLNISMASGGYNYIVEKVYGTEEGLTFQLKQTTEGPTTADMSAMTILVEMDKSWDCEPENIKIEYQ